MANFKLLCFIFFTGVLVKNNVCVSSFLKYFIVVHVIIMTEHRHSYTIVLKGILELKYKRELLNIEFVKLLKNLF